MDDKDKNDEEVRKSTEHTVYEIKDHCREFSRRARESLHSETKGRGRRGRITQEEGRFSCRLVGG